VSLISQYSSCYYRPGTNFSKLRQGEDLRIHLLGILINKPICKHFAAHH